MSKAPFTTLHTALNTTDSGNRVTLIIGTETGTAEFVADEIQEQFENKGLQVEQTLEPALSVPTSSAIWLVCTSTQGAGDPPNNLKAFYAWLDTQPDLKNVMFGVIGLGDSNYDTYCYAAKNIHKRLINCQATAIFDPILADAMSDELPEDIILPILDGLIIS